MAVAKDLSIVADSTTDASSPQPLMSVKRTARTYGKPRDSQSAIESDSTAFSSSNSSSRLNLLPTGPKNTLEEIPPTSDPEDASPKFEFAWRNALREIDTIPDNDLPSPSKSIEGKESLPGNTFSDNFNGEPLSPPSPPIGRGLKPKHTPILTGTDLDSPFHPPIKQNETLLQSSPTSPDFSHAITTTPMTVATSTPPTSDPEREDDITSIKNLETGKRDIEPLNLFESDCSDVDVKQTDKGKAKDKRKRSKIKVNFYFRY
jgi:hypothetical protein